MDDISAYFAASLQSSEGWLDNDITALNNDGSSSFLQIDDSFLNGESDSNSKSLDVQFMPSNIEGIQNYDVLDPAYENFLEDSKLSVLQGAYDGKSTSSLWGSTNFENFKMDEIFQVDKEEFFHGPTLAELNANDESLFDTFNNHAIFRDLRKEKLLPSIYSIPHPLELCNASVTLKCCDNSVSSHIKNTNVHSKEWSCFQDTETQFCQKNEDSSVGDTSSISSIKNASNLCLEMKTKVSNEEKCKSTPTKLSSQRLNDVKRKILVSQKLQECPTDESSINENFCEIPSSAIETFAFEENTDDESSSSSIDSYDEAELRHGRGSKRGRHIRSNKETSYFWQYNTQAKGPRCKRPHYSKDVLSSTRASIQDLTQSRRSDSNDLTPCPQKLYNIGVELKKLNSHINSLTPVNAVAFNARPRCRKEKNKLASRVCRLKKKAQYEANKLKLHGLQQEYDSLLHINEKMKELITCKVNSESTDISCEKLLEEICSNGTTLSDATSQTEFVNSILKNVESGDPTGGLKNWFPCAIKSKKD